MLENATSENSLRAFGKADAKECSAMQAVDRMMEVEVRHGVCKN